MKESFNRPSSKKLDDSSPERALSPREIEKIKESAFRSIILSTLNDTFIGHLDDVGFSEDEIHSIESTIGQMSFEEATVVFGIPASIVEKKFKKLLASVRAGELVATEIPHLLLIEAREKGFMVGYHNSSYEIHPNKTTGDWHVRATEKDHRDDDMPRAYYATSYKTLYRSKHSLKFLYIVRALRDNTKTDGNWSRSNSLSIIEEVPLDRIDKWVADAVENTRKTKKNEHHS